MLAHKTPPPLVTCNVQQRPAEGQHACASEASGQFSSLQPQRPELAHLAATDLSLLELAGILACLADVALACCVQPVVEAVVLGRLLLVALNLSTASLAKLLVRLLFLQAVHKKAAAAELPQRFSLNPRIL